MRRGGHPAYTLDDYEITRDGHVINKHSGREQKYQYNTKGYPRVIIGGKKYFIHRLVAEKFVPNPENKPQVNHIDGDRTNNCADNLEWVTNKENREHALLTGLQWSNFTMEDVKFIRNHPEIGVKELADKFHTSTRCVSRILQGKTFKNIKQLKRYAELTRNEV